MAVTIHSDMVRAADLMPKAQRSAFLVALIDYGEKGIEPEGRPTWLPTFETCKDRLDMGNAKREKAKRMAEARWGKHDKDDDEHDAQAECTSMMHEHDAQAQCTDDAKHDTELSRVEQSRVEQSGGDKRRSRFVAPTPEEVRAYAAERGLRMDPEDFCDYYGAQGWKLSNGNPMKDWRLAANRWAKAPSRSGHRSENYQMAIDRYAGYAMRQDEEVAS